MKRLKKLITKKVAKRKKGSSTDVHTKEQRSYNMSQIRGKDTKPELALRRALWALGLRYRIHYKLPGKPDIVFVTKKTAIFIDGCFWHGCPEHSTKPKTNASFWNKKILGNIERDRKIEANLRYSGWLVIRVWEHDIKHSISKISEIIYKAVIKNVSK